MWRSPLSYAPLGSIILRPAEGGVPPGWLVLFLSNGTINVRHAPGPRIERLSLQSST
jgi:hypothetical protein